MNQANVKVSFYLKKSEADADGMCPVMAIVLAFEICSLKCFILTPMI